MAKKRKPSEMPEGIDLDEWEEMVAERVAAIRYDEEFLKLCEWFISADAAADVIQEQFTRSLSDKDRLAAENILRLLSFIDWCIKCPLDYWADDVETYIDNYGQDETTPREILEPMLRLSYSVMASVISMRDNNPYGY